MQWLPRRLKTLAVVAFYVISMLALSYHLLHGFQKSFQTMGIRRKKYEGLIRGTGTFIFGILILALSPPCPSTFYSLTNKHLCRNESRFKNTIRTTR